MFRISFTLLLLALSTYANAYSSIFTLYDDEFQLGEYVTQPSEVIKRALKSIDWQFEEQQPNTIRGELNYKEYKLVVDILYSGDKIWFKEVSKEYFGCRKKPCKVKQRHIDRWRLNLRRHIALEITKLAEKDAMSKSLNNNS